ncbi:ketopantoate reductase family protein [Paenibacillus ihumii]|uniref:ketopantoate reductase family protein n=1 Tax=Paenibacillus ihumii TaxID=687436 RepID=UPI0006D7661F|nr:2-dehydropantoate 2-reductase [Paenibacillus ihumii]
MKVEIVGAGALGLLFGGKLASSGEEVRFWTKSEEQARLLAEEGILLQEGENGAPAIISGLAAYPLQKAASRCIGQENPDWVLVAAKQHHIDNALVSAIGPLLGEGTQILCFQNGIGHLELLAKAFPGTGVYAAITTEGAKRPSIRHVIRSGKGTTSIGLSAKEGEKADLYSKNAAEKLIVALETAGFSAHLSKDIDREIYRKLLINAAINPLTAIWRISNGELLEKAERRLLLKQLCEEALAVYAAEGIVFEGDAYDAVAEVCRLTSSNMSSMLKDVLQGTPTEIDYINGRLVEMAKQTGTPVPGHETVWRLIRGFHQ